MDDDGQTTRMSVRNEAEVILVVEYDDAGSLVSRLTVSIGQPR